MNKAFGLIVIASLISGRLIAGETPYVIGAIGDSISAGFNSLRLGDNREVSWSTGLNENVQIESHAKKIQKILGDRPIEIHNEAFVGATSADLDREATRLLRYKPDYVTLLIGANDICNWKGNYDVEFALYTERLERVVQRLIQANPYVRIVMPSLPDIMHVYKIGIANDCQVRWNSIGLCQPLFGKDRTPEERSAFGERLTTLNQIIRTVATRYPVNVAFKPELTNYQFPSEFLSAIDCFHPSILGHNKITEVTFDPSWF